MSPETKPAGTAQSLISSLYRSEFARMVALLGRRFGLAHIEQAEDIAAETFLLAAEHWAVKGTPPNPAAWLCTVAKRKMLQHLRREAILMQKVMPALAASEHGTPADDEVTPHRILDSQLGMIFAVCDNQLASEAQIALALRILCGLGIDEIAAAFLTSKETINKRLFRAREKLRTAGLRAELPPPHEVTKRTGNVLRVIYLLFNEGYYSRSENTLLRQDLCYEAMRLAAMLAEYAPTAVPETHALLALMCFHASRFTARGADAGILFDEQDASLWDQNLFRQGYYFLDKAATGSAVSKYHLEAMIAACHAGARDDAEKWRQILACYDLLLQIEPSPPAILNRIYAFYRVHGAASAKNELENAPVLRNHFWHVLMAEICRSENSMLAQEHLQQALSLTANAAERAAIQKKLCQREGDKPTK